jgi:hypothetical protein
MSRRGQKREAPLVPAQSLFDAPSSGDHRIARERMKVIPPSPQYNGMHGNAIESMEMHQKAFGYSFEGFSILRF